MVLIFCPTQYGFIQFAFNVLEKTRKKKFFKTPNNFVKLKIVLTFLYSTVAIHEKDVHGGF